METILITGANRGIGLELTKQYLSSHHLVIATCRNPEDASALAALQCDNLRILEMNVIDNSSVNDAAAQLTDCAIDILINNAGIMGGENQSVGNMDYDSWRDTFEVNTIAPFRVVTAFLGNLKKAARPRAVTISSMMGSLNRKSSGSYAYRSSKAAVNKVMQVLAEDLRAESIIVCPVHPGWVRTDMGGSAADISVEESGTGLIKLIDSLTLDSSGRFWTWNGDEHDW